MWRDIILSCLYYSMSDLLFESATAYSELMQYRYDFICGRNKSAISFSVFFPKKKFQHLAGLHYSRISSLKDKEKALELALSHSVTLDMLIKSGFSHLERLENVSRLKWLIENNRIVFYANMSKLINSRIEADYVLKTENIYFFVKNESPVSIVTSEDNARYEFGLSRYKALEISRTNLVTGEVFQVYRSSHFLETEPFGKTELSDIRSCFNSDMC